MELDKKDKEIYKQMLGEIIKQNTYGYPMIMTVSTKHDLECPSVLRSVGFKTGLKVKMSKLKNQRQLWLMIKRKKII